MQYVERIQYANIHYNTLIKVQLTLRNSIRFDDV